jgi:hypothetical protein
VSYDPLKNFARSTVATAPSPANSGTSLVLATGDGALFPDPATLGAFNVVIWPANTDPTPANAEVVRVTARATDTLTITRATESSSARTVVVGDSIALAVTAKTLTDLEAGASLVDKQTFTADGTWTKPAGATWVRVTCIGAGGGGGAGSNSAGSANAGGSGGNGGNGKVIVESW